MQRIFSAAVLLLAASVFGCGGGQSDEARVESVLRMYIEHYVDSQPAEMYALLDSGSRVVCSEDAFVTFISAARDALGQRDFVVSEVRNVVVEGDTASATVVSTVDGEQADPTANTLIKENGEWRLELPSGGC